MTNVPDTPAIEPESMLPPARSLGRVVVGGFVWSFGLSIAAKGVTLVAQILLARLLLPKDYAVVSLATAMAVMPSIIRDGGATQVLIQRQDQFARLANPAFWMSAILGVISAVTIVALAPLGSLIYQSAILPKLMLILAITAAVNAISVVPVAKLQIDLRLRLSAVLNAAVPIATALFSVLMAWQHFGAYALVAPLLVVAALRVIACWILSPTAIRRQLDFRNWRTFFVDGGLLMGTGLFWSITTQGDYALLGLLDQGDALGYYVFAFGLSMQSMQLLGGTLNGIMFAALTRIKGDEVRQRHAITEATRLSAAVMLPVALFPVLCPSAILRLLFGEKWLPATTLLQLLSVAAALASVGYPMGSYLMAQGRNRTVFAFSAAMAAFFLVVVAIGTMTAGANGTAVAVSAFQLTQTIIGLHLVLHRGGPTARLITQVIGMPLLISAAALSLSAVVMSLPTLRELPALSLILVSFAVMGSIYLLLLHIFANDIARKLLLQFRNSLT